jgi:hypothetical protein
MNTPAPTVALSLKPDLAATAARFDAWWQGGIADRSPITLPATPLAAAPTTDDSPRTPRQWREHWLHVEDRVDDAIARLQARGYPADNLPVLMPNVGPELTATLYGCELEFGPHTSWSTPIVHTLDDWHRLLEREPDFTGVYWQTIERMLGRACERCDGRYIVGLPDLHGNFDILAALRDPQQLCLDLVDAPELVAKAALHVARGYNAALARACDVVGPLGGGYSTWTPFHASMPAYLPSCDFWCMISADDARQHVMPAILEESRLLSRSLFHLDGPAALRHLDLLLEWKQLDAVQWVYGAGQEPASRWIDVYSRIRAAGKSVQLIAVDVDDACAVIRHLGLQGVWVCCQSLSPCASADEAIARILAAGLRNPFPPAAPRSRRA